MVVADMGNVTAGEPVITTDLRGHVKAIVELSTLRDPVHSGLFGGAAPDALMALIKLLAQITDDDGTCAIPGILSGEWAGAEYSEEMLRTNAGVLDGVDLVGTGGVASRLWSKPSISVLGIDCPSVDEGGNVLQPRARAVVAMRIPPGQDENDAMDALITFLRDHVTGGVHVEVTPNKKSPAFHQGSDGSAFAQMSLALQESYGRDVDLVGSGGSIPLLDELRKASPAADFVLIGAEDAALSRIHGPNESVDPSEIEHMALAQVLLIQSLASTAE
jgi:acetylornithine deacetylase/succinyl-diaminopimelate desuccinylase-like protein